MNKVLLKAIRAWDVLIHGCVLAWDEERGIHYRAPTGINRLDLLKPALKIVIAGGWMAAVASAVFIIIAR